MNPIFENDGWVFDGKNIVSEESLHKVGIAIGKSVIVLEHRFYRGSKAPKRLFFEEYEEFLTYIKEESSPGDAFRIWSFSETCHDQNTVAAGKFPDEQGRTPLKGAY